MGCKEMKRPGMIFVRCKAPSVSEWTHIKEMITKDKGHRHGKRRLGIDGETDSDEREACTTT